MQSDKLSFCLENVVVDVTILPLQFFLHICVSINQRIHGRIPRNACNKLAGLHAKVRREMTREISCSFAFTLAVLLISLLSKITCKAEPAVFVFGDSLVDQGNNNYLDSLAKSDFPPYGIDLDQGPTGRFCNGKTIIDFICDLLNTSYILPSEDPTARGTRILGGVNFASAASGILDDSGLNYGERISLSKQVINFESMLEEVRNLTGNDIRGYLAKAVAVLVFGSNDYVNNYLLPSMYSTSYYYNTHDYATLLIQHYTRQILALHSLGLRRFAIAGLGPLGCIPNQLAAGEAPSGSCVTRVNDMVGLLNNGLVSMVNELNSNHSEAVFIYADVYRIVGEILNDPTSFGFTVRDRGCCGVGTDKGQIDCLPLSPPCTNRTQYVFWDNFHPTEAVNRILASRVYSGSPSDCYPINVSQMLMI